MKELVEYIAKSIVNAIVSAGMFTIGLIDDGLESLGLSFRLSTLIMFIESLPTLINALLDRLADISNELFLQI